MTCPGKRPRMAQAPRCRAGASLNSENVADKRPSRLPCPQEPGPQGLGQATGFGGFPRPPGPPLPVTTSLFHFMVSRYGSTSTTGQGSWRTPRTVSLLEAFPGTARGAAAGKRSQDHREPQDLLK